MHEPINDYIISFFWEVGNSINEYTAIAYFLKV